MPLGRPSLRPYLAYRQPGSTAADGLSAYFLGTSSVLLADGQTAVLADGFVTRPGLSRVVAGRIAPDPAIVRAAIERLGAPELAAVFCAHSHYDHALDAPLWSRETGADLVGSESTANIGRGLGLPESALRVVADGDTVGYGQFELTFIESVHSPGDHFPGTVDAPLAPPARAGEWKTGSAYSVLITHPRGRILLHASANHRPGMLAGRRADVVYLGVGVLGKQSPEFAETYWAEVVRATGARRVILVHWDDLFVGLDRPLRAAPNFFDRVDVGIDRVLALAARDDVEVLIPVAWQRSDPLA